MFGHMRNEDELRQQLVRRRFASFGAAGGAWEVKDVSHSGMRLIAPMDVATTITLGTLCALRASGQPAWALGVVRRMRRLTADRAEIGLQIIANTLIAVTLVEPRTQTPMPATRSTARPPRRRARRSRRCSSRCASATATRRCSR